MTHEYYRVYASGLHSRTLEVDDDALARLIAFNTVMRFGCAQYVDGRCVYHGYLTVDEAARHERQVAV